MTAIPIEIHLVVTGGAVAFVAPWFLPRGAVVPVATNYRGRRVPVVLGMAVLAALLLVRVGPMLLASAVRGEPLLEPLALLGGLTLVFAGGLYDDLRGGGGHGVAAQLRETLRGTPNPAFVKLIAAVAAAMLWILAAQRPWTHAIPGVVLVAGVTNTWNLLDVRPGRAAKWFILVGTASLWAAQTPFLVATIGAAVGVLWYDLTERAMLGDSGSFVLGYVLGISLFEHFGLVALWGAAAAVVLVHVLSETVTLSRVLRGSPPLRWFDDLGTVRSEPDRGPGPPEDAPDGPDPSRGDGPLIP